MDIHCNTMNSKLTYHLHCTLILLNYLLKLFHYLHHALILFTVNDSKLHWIILIKVFKIYQKANKQLCSSMLIQDCLITLHNLILQINYFRLCLNIILKKFLHLELNHKNHTKFVVLPWDLISYACIFQKIKQNAHQILS